MQATASYKQIMKITSLHLSPRGQNRINDIAADFLHGSIEVLICEHKSLLRRMKMKPNSINVLSLYLIIIISMCAKFVVLICKIEFLCFGSFLPEHKMLIIYSMTDPNAVGSF
jgi:hypothetical protein